MHSSFMISFGHKTQERPKGLNVQNYGVETVLGNTVLNVANWRDPPPEDYGCVAKSRVLLQANPLNHNVHEPYLKSLTPYRCNVMQLQV